MLVVLTGGGCEALHGWYITVTTGDRGMTEELFEAAARQLTRAVKCTGFEICEKACLKHAISLRMGASGWGMKYVLLFGMWVGF